MFKTFTKFYRERRDKDESLMRNAHMSQTLEIYRQEMRQQETEIGDLKGKIKQLENTLSQNIEVCKIQHQKSCIFVSRNLFICVPS